MQNIEKRPSILQKSCGVNAAKFLKYVWPFFNIILERVQLTDIVSLHKKWNFTLRISSVNVTKSAISNEFDHIYRRNPQWKTSFFLAVLAFIKGGYYQILFLFQHIGNIWKLFQITGVSVNSWWTWYFNQNSYFEDMHACWR